MPNCAPKMNHVEIVDVSYKSRTRSVNWDEKEKYLIIDSIRNHISTIENTRPDNDTNRKKKAVWQYVEQIFHEQGYNRDITRIKEQWRRLKGLAKKEVQNYNRLLELKVHVEDLQRPCNLYFEIWDMLGDTQNVDADSDSEDSNPMKKQKTDGDWYAYPNQDYIATEGGKLDEQVSEASLDIDLNEIKEEVEDLDEFNNESDSFKLPPLHRIIQEQPVPKFEKCETVNDIELLNLKKRLVELNIERVELQKQLDIQLYERRLRFENELAEKRMFYEEQLHKMQLALEKNVYRKRMELVNPQKAPGNE